MLDLGRPPAALPELQHLERPACSRAIWVLGLAGGVGVLRAEPWGRYLTELFCWALIVLVLLSAATRLYALRQEATQGAPVNWLGAIAGVTLILVPVLAICAATIVTLRSPEAMKAFS